MRKKTEIDLSNHHDPAKFIEEARKRFPDKNVKLSLNGTTMGIDISEKVPSQIMVEIDSFIRERANEDIMFEKRVR